MIGVHGLCGSSAACHRAQAGGMQHTATAPVTAHHPRGCLAQLSCSCPAAARVQPPQRRTRMLVSLCNLRRLSSTSRLCENTFRLTQYWLSACGTGQGPSHASRSRPFPRLPVPSCACIHCAPTCTKISAAASCPSKRELMLNTARRGSTWQEQGVAYRNGLHENAMLQCRFHLTAWGRTCAFATRSSRGPAPCAHLRYP